MPRTPSPKLHALWRDRVGRQALSGLTITEFCAREHLAAGSFHAWKRRLRLVDLAEQRPASAPSSAFLPITVRVVEHASDTPQPIEADLPNGIRLRIPTANPHLAGHLVRIVARARTDSGGSR
jgi:hypothetical protein